jgi:hypothetical protein
MTNRKEETSEETTDSSSDGTGVACNTPIVRCDSVSGEASRAGEQAPRMSVQRSDPLPSTEKYLAGVNAADLPVLDVREAGRNRLRWRKHRC